jgi:excisionase family DNA binding protein
MKDSLLKEKEICDYLNISRTTIWRYKKLGLPSYKVGNVRRFNLDEVKGWIAKEESSTYNSTIEYPVEPINQEFEKEKIFNDYRISFKYLLEHNQKYLSKFLSSGDRKQLESILQSIDDSNLDNQEIVKIFSAEYLKLIQKEFKKNNPPSINDEKLVNFINKDDEKIKVIWGDCYKALKRLDTESIQLMVTSPPYYNAREYSQWQNLELYLDEMKKIIHESYRVLDNHRVWVFNVGDIFDNDRIKTSAVWGKRRIPLGAYFIRIFEEEGFEFVDDIVWDKGEVESKRHMNNGLNYPFYQYPLNCYEHILIFHKHRLDKTKIPCPICGSLNVNGNTQSKIGVQSWECKNDKCFVRSPNNRGKRFSLRSNIMQYYHEGNGKNEIEKDMLGQWRRDIVRFPPVIKINNSGKNTLGHTAPFPETIPQMAVKYFSYIYDKVLDTFAGCFPTPIVAQLLNRPGIGIEINEGLFREAIINQIKKRVLLFGSEEPFTEYHI